jgi:hypothetical protein
MEFFTHTGAGVSINDFVAPAWIDKSEERLLRRLDDLNLLECIATYPLNLPACAATRKHFPLFVTPVLQGMTAGSYYGLGVH